MKPKKLITSSLVMAVSSMAIIPFSVVSCSKSKNTPSINYDSILEVKPGLIPESFGWDATLDSIEYKNQIDYRGNWVFQNREILFENHYLLSSVLQIENLEVKIPSNEEILISFYFDYNAQTYYQEVLISGFASNDGVSHEDIVNEAIENFGTPNLIANDEGKKLITRQLTAKNLSKYVSGLPLSQYPNGVYTSIKDVVSKDEELGTATVTITWRKGKFSKNVEYEATGFKSLSIAEEEFDRELSKITLVAKQPIASQTLASSVNLDNLSKYIDNLPTNNDDYNVEILSVNPSSTNSNNTKLTIEIKYISNVYKIEKTKTYEVDGFMTQNQSDENDIQDIVDEIEKATITVNEEGKKVLVNSLTKENIAQYVTGLPNSSYDNGVKTQIKAVEQTDVENGLATIIITYSKNESQRDVEYSVTGFRKPIQDAEDQFNEEISKIALNAKQPDASNKLVSEISLDNVNQYINNIPSNNETYSVEILRVNPSNENSNNKEITIEIKYTSVKYSTITKTINYQVDGFMSQDELDEQLVQDSIQEYGTPSLTANAAGQEILVNDLTTENIKQYVDNLPKTSFENGVTTSIKEVQKTNPTIGKATIVVTYSKGNISKDVEYVVEGFKTTTQNAEEIFNSKVEEVKLTATELAATFLAKNVTKENVTTYVNGIPNSEENFVVEIINVSPKTAESTNSILIVELKFSDPAFSLSTTKSYEVDGFMTQNQSDENDINEIIDSIQLANIKVNDEGKKVLVNSLTKENIAQYVTGLPEASYEGGVTTLIKEVQKTDNENGIATIVVTYSKGNVSKDVEYVVEGFKKQIDQTQEDFMQAIEAIELVANETAAETLVSTVNPSNVHNYISNLPSSNDLYNVEIISVRVLNDTSTNTKIVIEIKYTNPKYETISQTKSYEVDGFMSQDQYDEQLVDAAITEYGKPSLVANEEGKTILVKDVSISNIEEYVDNLPNKEFTNKVTTSIVEIKNRNSELGSLTIVVTYSKGNISKSEEYTVTGFKTSAQSAEEDFELAIEEIALKANEKAADTLVSTINKTNVKTYVDGIPENTETLHVEILSVSPLNENADNSTISVELKFTHPQYPNLEKTKTYQVDGFMSQNTSDQKDIDQIKSTVNIQVNEQGQQTLVSDLSPENIVDKVTGIPTASNGVTITINSIEQTNVAEGIATIVIIYSKGEMSDKQRYEVSGFKTLIQDAQEKFEAEVAKVELTSNAQTPTILAKNVTSENVKTYVDGIPENKVDFVVEIKEVRPLNNESTNDTLVVVLAFTNPNYQSLKAEKTYNVSGFMTQNQSDENDIQTSIDKVTSTTIKVNELGQQTLVANLPKNNDISNYVTGMPPIQDPDNGVTTSVVDVKETSLEDGTATIVIKFTKGEQSKTEEFVVTGFKTLKQQAQDDFDQAVKNISLSAKQPDASNKLVSEVTTDDVKDYVIGIPESTEEFNVEIIAVAPKSSTGSNKILLVTLKLSNPKYSDMSIQPQAYEVDGFMSQDEADVKIINETIESFDKDAMVVNEEGKTTLVSQLTTENIYSKVDNLPMKNFENGVKTEITSIERTNVNLGIATIVVVYSKNNSSKEVKYEIEGFKLTDEAMLQKIQEEINKLPTSYETTEEGKNTFVTSIRKENIREFAPNLPQSTDLYVVEILKVVNSDGYNNNWVTVTIKFTNDTYGFEMEKDFIVSGFKLLN